MPQTAWLRTLDAFRLPLYPAPSLRYYPPMPYEITAARKRPRGFEELAGQDFVSATLEASLESSRIAHAYLFSGPRGCGKTSTARILAKALNCERGPTSRPCGTCSSCRSIQAGSSLDVIEIDGASNTSVDNVRQIKDEVLFPPNGGRYKVYIIDEVHMLSMSAFNALLKTIEEPPPYVVFIFATTELHKVPATIKSRCQQFAFRLVPVEILKGLLLSAAGELGVKADDEALLWIAKEAAGSVRDAYTLFDQVLSFSEGHVTAAKIRDKLGLVGLDSMNALFEACVAGDASAPAGAAGSPAGPQAGSVAGRALEALDAILSRGVSPEQALVDSVEYCRSLLLLKNGIARESLLGAAPAAYSPAVLEAFSSEQIERALAGLLELHRNIRFTVDPRFELELAVSRLCRLRDYVAPSELARVVSGLRRRLAEGGSQQGGSALGGASPGGRPSGRGLQPEPRARAEDGGRLSDDDGLEGGGPAEPEKKKPELPTSLKSAFSSLAAAAAAAEPEAPVAPMRRPMAAPVARAAQDSGREAPRAAVAAAQAAPGAPAGPMTAPAAPGPQAAAPAPARQPIAPPPPDRDGVAEDEEEDPEGGETWVPEPAQAEAAGQVPAAGDGVAGLSVSPNAQGAGAGASPRAARPAAGAPEAAPPAGLDPEELKRLVIESLGRSSPLLKSGLSASLRWRIEDERVVVPFRSGMEESLLKGELGVVSRAVAQAAGRAYKVELRVEPDRPRGREGQAPSGAAGPEGPGGEEAAGDPVAVVERVFRGTRVKERESGGRGEY